MCITSQEPEHYGITLSSLHTAGLFWGPLVGCVVVTVS